MDYQPGQLCFLSDGFFKKVNDPKLGAGFKGGSRPFYVVRKDENTGLLWVAPCSTQLEKYENLIAKREAEGKSTEGIQLEKIFGVKSAILLQDMFPVTGSSIREPYKRGGKLARLTNPSQIAKYEQISRRIEKRFRHHKSPVTYRPDAMRIEKKMMEDERKMNNENALAEFTGTIGEIQERLGDLKAYMENYMNVIPYEANWGHVGNAAHFLEKFTELTNHAFGRDEETPVANNANVLADFVGTIGEVKNRIDALKSYADDHMNVSPDEVNFGHVGSANYLLEGLTELTNYANERGSEAPAVSEDKPPPTVQNYLEEYRRGVNDGYADNTHTPHDFLPETHSGADSYNVRHGYSPELYGNTFPAMEVIGVPPVHNSEIIDELESMLGVDSILTKDPDYVKELLETSVVSLEKLIDAHAAGVKDGTQVARNEQYSLDFSAASREDIVAKLKNYHHDKQHRFSVYETNDGNLNLFVQDHAGENVNFAHDYKEHPKDIVPAIKAVQGGDDAKTWDGHDEALAELFDAVNELGVLVANNDGLKPSVMQETAQEGFRLTLNDFLEFEKYTRSPPEEVNFDKLQELAQKFSSVSRDERYEIADDLAQQEMGVSWEDYYEYAKHMESPEMENMREQSVLQEITEHDGMNSSIISFVKIDGHDNIFTTACGMFYDDALDAADPVQTAEYLAISVDEFFAEYETHYGKAHPLAQPPENLSSSHGEKKFEQSSEISELLQLLNDNGKTEQATALSDLINHVKSMESTVKTCSNSIVEMKTQLDTMQESKNYPIKEALQKIVKGLENDARHIKGLCGQAKNGLKSGCKNALVAAKERGIEVLGKMSSFFSLREHFEKVENKAQSTIDRCERAIEKIEAFSKESHKLGNALKNIGRMITGKDPLDRSPEAGKLANALCAPFRSHRERNVQIRDDANEAIKSLNRLSERAEAIHEKRSAKKTSFDERMANAKGKAATHNSRKEPQKSRDNRDERN